jgi:hypothetical protein
MKARFLLCNLAIIFVLAVVPMATAYAQEGTYSQPGKANGGIYGGNPNPGPLPPGVKEGPQGGTELRPSDAHSDVPLANPTPVQRSARWGFFVFGVVCGLFFGALAWRRPRYHVDDIRRDRAA